jgi:predicted GH43/DUF377 family glycosyl hydrolase
MQEYLSYIDMSILLFVYIAALLFSIFVVGAILGAFFSRPFRERLVEFLGLHRASLGRSDANPILSPGANGWTAESVMNPAAFVLDGKTHLIYRAVGSDGVSRLGYASSTDGVTFDHLPSYPAYVARSPRAPSRRDPRTRRYSPVMYPSGGSWGGCEDPRAVVIDGRVYVTFNMFDGWDFIRVAVISMDADDFLDEHFGKWEGPFILSPDGQRHKNWVLFPEKVHGRFAILHSLFGTDDDHVRIEYTDDIESYHAPDDLVSPDPLAAPDDHIAWHYRMRSAGPPPVKTDRGWLVFYHAMDPKEPSRYKMGALLLDLDDPTKILHRAQLPVLEPDAGYENNGKPGVIYACGALARDGQLYVYYGGADKVTCVASAPTEEFLDNLIEGENAALTEHTV